MSQVKREIDKKMFKGFGKLKLAPKNRYDPYAFDDEYIENDDARREARKALEEASAR